MAAAPVYRWLTRQTPGVLRWQLGNLSPMTTACVSRRMPRSPQQMPTLCRRKRGRRSRERMQTELDLRDKEAGEGHRCLEAAGQSRQPQPPQLQDFLRRFCVLRESKAGPGRVRPEPIPTAFFGVRQPAPHQSRWKAGSKKSRSWHWSLIPATLPPASWCAPFWRDLHPAERAGELFHRMNLHLIQADNAVRRISSSATRMNSSTP